MQDDTLNLQTMRFQAHADAVIPKISNSKPIKITQFGHTQNNFKNSLQFPGIKFTTFNQNPFQFYRII